jgi:hypothetical protein
MPKRSVLEEHEPVLRSLTRFRLLSTALKKQNLLVAVTYAHCGLLRKFTGVCPQKGVFRCAQKPVSVRYISVDLSWLCLT